MPDEAGKSDRAIKVFKFISALICDPATLWKEQNSFRFISVLIQFCNINFRARLC